MKNILFSVFLFFLSGCATPEEAKTVFIDSNITADVYIGDVKVGTTPYMDKISGEKREMISLRKTGYKTAELPLKTIYKANYRPAAYAITGGTSSTCNKYKYPRSAASDQVLNDLGACGGYIYMASVGTTIFGSGILTVSIDMTPVPQIIQYDRDSYFIEMIPENKKAFTKEELKQMRTRLMVLRTFNELKASSPEYAFTLFRLTGKPFIPPAPDMTPGTYLRLIEK
jgi:hypothetical protein